MRLSLVLLLIAVPCNAQSNWPGVQPLEVNNTLHDLGHAATASAVIGGTGLLTDWPLETRMALGALVWPLAAETYDFLRYTRDWDAIPWNDKASDFLSYQLPWAYWFAKRGRWVSSVYTVLLYATWLYWRHWADPVTPIRDSYWWHGAVVGGYMAGLALIFNVNPRASYIQANAALGFREVLQLASGQGEWTDLMSGLLLPLPYLMER
jgi:hypothetical protein